MINEGITLAGAEGVYGCLFEPNDEYWIALYDEGAKLGADVHGYIADGEIRGQGYRAGGKPIGAPKIQRDGNCFIWDFEDVSWPNSSISASAALIYNKTRSRSLCVLSFPRTMSRNGTFRLVLPPPTANEGAVRFYY